MKLLLIHTALFLIFYSNTGLYSQNIPLLLHGHSHNDYKQKKPLTQALSLGFTSIEVDVLNHKNNIMVAHSRWSIKNQNTLEEMYLKPLKNIILANNGTVFLGDSTPLYFMIDIKSNADEMYGLLKQCFAKYTDIVEYRDEYNCYWGPVKVVISGNKPIKSLKNDTLQYFSLDGDWYNIDSNINQYDRPMVSASYPKHIKKMQKHRLSARKVKSIKNQVQLAKNLNLKTRFWGIGNDTRVWKILLEAGVYWINVNDLKKFAVFYSNYNKP